MYKTERYIPWKCLDKIEVRQNIVEVKKYSSASLYDRRQWTRKSSRSWKRELYTKICSLLDFFSYFDGPDSIDSIDLQVWA